MVVIVVGCIVRWKLGRAEHQLLLLVERLLLLVRHRRGRRVRRGRLVVAERRVYQLRRGRRTHGKGWRLRARRAGRRGRRGRFEGEVQRELHVLMWWFQNGVVFVVTCWSVQILRGVDLLMDDWLSIYVNFGQTQTAPTAASVILNL